MGFDINAFQELNLDGFQVVSGNMFTKSHQNQAITCTVWCDSISFGKKSFKALNRCDRVLIRVHPEKKSILVSPTTESDKDSVEWISSRSREPRRISCAAFTKNLYEKWGWDKDYVYSCMGRLVTVDNKVMLLFNCEDPRRWEYAERRRKNKQR